MGQDSLDLSALRARIAGEHSLLGRVTDSEIRHMIEVIEALWAAAEGLLFCAAMNYPDVPEPWKQHLDALSAALGRVTR